MEVINDDKITLLKDGVEKEYDLLLSGHTHNGMVPKILNKLLKKNQGIIAPNKKLFPEIARGKIEVNMFNKKITLIEDIKPLLTELRRIGNNLNQITKLANMGKVDAINLTETSEALAETYQAVYLLARTNGGANWQS